MQLWAPFAGFDENPYYIVFISWVKRLSKKCTHFSITGTSKVSFYVKIHYWWPLGERDMWVRWCFFAHRTLQGGTWGKKQIVLHLYDNSRNLNPLTGNPIWGAPFFKYRKTQTHTWPFRNSPEHQTNQLRWEKGFHLPTKPKGSVWFGRKMTFWWPCTTPLQRENFLTFLRGDTESPVNRFRRNKVVDVVWGSPINNRPKRFGVNWSRNNSPEPGFTNNCQKPRKTPC